MKAMFKWQQRGDLRRHVGVVRDRQHSLGLHHIAEGTDHLLFLLAPLLPAPHLASRAGGGERWGAARGVRASVRAMVGVVSGFTVGHSTSLALAACGLVDVPTRLVEVLVAASILVSALHAWRPLFAGVEIWIAAAFGLVHGLAFAEVLSGLDFDGATLALSLVGFNLGIDAMQLAVVAPPPPWAVATLVLASLACTVVLVRRAGLSASTPPGPAVAPAARSAACGRTAQ